MPKSFPRWLAAALFLAVILQLAGGAWFYSVQERHLTGHAEKELQSIAQLKSDQIVAWRADHLAEASELMSSHFLIQGVVRWMADPRPKTGRYIRSRLQSVQDHYLYRDVMLVDPGGKIRFSLGNRKDAIHDEVRQALTVALHDRKAVLTDLHAGPADPIPHMGVIAPLFAGIGGTAGPVGAVILQIDARQFLYPLIAS